MTQHETRPEDRAVGTSDRVFVSYTALSGTGVASALADADLQLPRGVTLRGIYDLTGFRADSDALVWLHGPDAEALQLAVRRLSFGVQRRQPVRTWSAMGVHTEAEFNRGHIPAFLAGHPARGWACVYPFVRSYDWYVLPAADRRDMLAEHGRSGSAFPSVLANTVASFALGDYEWLLALESDELTDIVDLMRALRETRARLHVREEIPFFTGRLVRSQASS